MPLVLKTRRYGYDGKGQAWIREPERGGAAWAAIGGEPAVAEAGVDFDAEFSVIVARWADGRTPSGISPRTSIARASCAARPCRAATQSPRRSPRRARPRCAIAEALGHVGVLTVEFFASRGRPASSTRSRRACTTAATGRSRARSPRSSSSTSAPSAACRRARPSWPRARRGDGQSHRRRGRTAGRSCSPTPARTSTSTARARRGRAARWATSRGWTAVKTTGERRRQRFGTRPSRE